MDKVILSIHKDATGNDDEMFSSWEELQSDSSLRAHRSSTANWLLDEGSLDWIFFQKSRPASSLKDGQNASVLFLDYSSEGPKSGSSLLDLLSGTCQGLLKVAVASLHEVTTSGNESKLLLSCMVVSSPYFRPSPVLTDQEIDNYVDIRSLCKSTAINAVDSSEQTQRRIFQRNSPSLSPNGHVVNSTDSDTQNFPEFVNVITKMLNSKSGMSIGQLYSDPSGRVLSVPNDLIVCGRVTLRKSDIWLSKTIIKHLKAAENEVNCNRKRAWDEFSQRLSTDKWNFIKNEGVLVQLRQSSRRLTSLYFEKLVRAHLTLLNSQSQLHQTTPPLGKDLPLEAMSIGVEGSNEDDEFLPTANSAKDYRPHSDPPPKSYPSKSMEVHDSNSGKAEVTIRPTKKRARRDDMESGAHPRRNRELASVSSHNNEFQKQRAGDDNSIDDSEESGFSNERNITVVQSRNKSNASLTSRHSSSPTDPVLPNQVRSGSRSSSSSSRRDTMSNVGDDDDHDGSPCAPESTRSSKYPSCYPCHHRLKKKSRSKGQKGTKPKSNAIYLGFCRDPEERENRTPYITLKCIRCRESISSPFYKGSSNIRRTGQNHYANMHKEMTIEVWEEIFEREQDTLLEERSMDLNRAIEARFKEELTYGYENNLPPRSSSSSSSSTSKFKGKKRQILSDEEEEGQEGDVHSSLENNKENIGDLETANSGGEDDRDAGATKKRKSKRLRIRSPLRSERQIAGKEVKEPRKKKGSSNKPNSDKVKVVLKGWGMSQKGSLQTPHN